MKVTQLILYIAAIMWVQGCSTITPRDHQLASDVAVKIVKKIRCETGHAIKALIAGGEYEEVVTHPKFGSFVITSQVDFAITEDKSANAALSLSIPFITGDSLTLELGGGQSLQRKGERQIIKTAGRTALVLTTRASTTSSL